MSNKLDKLLTQAHKVRAWLSQPESQLYGDFLLDYRQECLDKLMRESDPVRIHRLQGSIEVLDFTLGLRSEMDNYIKGVSSGQMRKIGKEEQHAVGK